MTIVLLGYMGSGKSLIGKGLANILINFIDLDEYIESKEKISIQNIFQNTKVKFILEKKKLSI